LKGGDSAARDKDILAKINSCDGCLRRPDLDTSHAYAFSINNSMTRGLDRLFFVPHGANSGFHTVDQIATIETALARFGIDLLPLDSNLG
jgi:hypothetical protein